MKKVIVTLLIFLLVLFGIIFYSIFTPSGSNLIVKPIINKKIKQRVKNVDIKIKKLYSKYRYLDIDALVENSVDINAKGRVNYFKKSFDLNYKATANKVVIDNRAYPLNLNIKGKTEGNINSFIVDGYGKGFNSNIGYRVQIHNAKAQSIKVNINNAELSQLFLITRVKPLIDGLAFVNIKMPSLNIKNPSGEARIEVRNGKFNNKLITKKYKINLPKNETFNAKIDTQVANKKVIGEGVLNSTSVKLKIKKLISTLDFKVIKAYIDANIDDLSRFEGIIKNKINGSLSVNGVIYSNLNQNLLQARLKSKSFGGLTKMFYSNNSIKLNLKDLSIVKVENMFYRPLYVTNGVISGVVKIPNIDKLNSYFNIKSSGSINKKIINIKLPSYQYNLTAVGKFVNGSLDIKNSNLNISDINLLLSSLKYNFLTNALTSNFKLKIDNLSKLKTLIQSRLRGGLSFSGKLAKLGDNIDLHANTHSLGGDVNLFYNGKTLKAKLKNVSAYKLFYMLNEPSLLQKGFINANIKLNSLTKLEGVLSIVTNGSVDTKLVRKLYEINLGRNFDYHLTSKHIEMLKDIIKAKTIKINSNIFYLELSDLMYRKNRGNFKSQYYLKVDNLLDLKPLIKQKLAGDLKLKGVLEKDGSNILVSGVTSKFGGNVNFRLKNSNLNISGAGVNIIEVLDMLNKPRFLDGISTFVTKYNIKSKKGDFNATISHAKILKSSIIKKLKKYANFDISKEVFNDVKIDGGIDNTLVTFNLNAKGQRIRIIINNGTIDTKTQTINAKVTIKFKDKDYNFKLTGPLDEPNIRISFSGAVKEKVLEKVKDKLKESGLADEIDKLIPKELKGEGITGHELEKKVKKKAKELFKNLF